MILAISGAEVGVLADLAPSCYKHGHVPREMSRTLRMHLSERFAQVTRRKGSPGGKGPAKHLKEALEQNEGPINWSKLAMPKQVRRETASLICHYLHADPHGKTSSLEQRFV